MSRQGEENRQETTDKICVHCPAKTHRQQRENKTTPLCRVRTPTEDVFVRQQKTVYLKTGTKRETVATQGRAWLPSDQCSLPLCECIQNLFPRIRTACLRIDSASHWTLYNIVFRGMRFSAHRQLMSYLTRSPSKRNVRDEPVRKISSCVELDTALSCRSRPALELGPERSFAVARCRKSVYEQTSGVLRHRTGSRRERENNCMNHPPAHAAAGATARTQ